MHPCLYQGSIHGFNGPKLSGTHGMVRGMTKMHYGSHVVGAEGLAWCVFVDSTSLTNT